MSQKFKKTNKAEQLHRIESDFCYEDYEDQVKVKRAKTLPRSTQPIEEYQEQQIQINKEKSNLNASSNQSTQKRSIQNNKDLSSKKSIRNLQQVDTSGSELDRELQRLHESHSSDYDSEDSRYFSVRHQALEEAKSFVSNNIKSAKHVKEEKVKGKMKKRAVQSENEAILNDQPLILQEQKQENIADQPVIYHDTENRERKETEFEVGDFLSIRHKSRIPIKIESQQDLSELSEHSEVEQVNLQIPESLIISINNVITIRQHEDQISEDNELDINKLMTHSMIEEGEEAQETIVYSQKQSNKSKGNERKSSYNSNKVYSQNQNQQQEVNSRTESGAELHSHYSRINLALNIDSDREVEFEGYGRVTLKEINKQDSPLKQGRETEKTRITHFQSSLLSPDRVREFNQEPQMSDYQRHAQQISENSQKQRQKAPVVKLSQNKRILEIQHNVSLLFPKQVVF